MNHCTQCGTRIYGEPFTRPDAKYASFTDVLCEDCTPPCEAYGCDNKRAQDSDYCDECGADELEVAA